jgi:hypothetical protein
MDDSQAARWTPAFKSVANKLRSSASSTYQQQQHRHHSHPRFSRHAAPTKTIKVLAEGKITLSPKLHGCTLTTLSASIGVVPSAAELAAIQPNTKNHQIAEPESAAAASSSPRATGNRISAFLARTTMKQGPRTTDNKSSIPSSKHGRLFLDHFMAAVPALHARYARYKEVDAARLKHFQNVEIPSSPLSTSSETKLITEQLNLFDRREDVGNKRHRIPGTINDSVSYHQQFEDNECAIGEAEADFDASPGRVFAEIWCLDTNERINRHIDKSGAKVMRKVLHIPGSRSMLFMNVVHLGAALSDRIFFTWFTWMKDESGGFVVAFADAERCPDKVHIDAMEAMISGDAKAAGAVKGTTSGMWKITRLADNVCRLKYTVQVNLGGKSDACRYQHKHQRVAHLSSSIY